MWSGSQSDPIKISSPAPPFSIKKTVTSGSKKQDAVILNLSLQNNNLLLNFNSAALWYSAIHALEWCIHIIFVMTEIVLVEHNWTKCIFKKGETDKAFHKGRFYLIINFETHWNLWNIWKNGNWAVFFEWKGYFSYHLLPSLKMLLRGRLFSYIRRTLWRTLTTPTNTHHHHHCVSVCTEHNVLYCDKLCLLHWSKCELDGYKLVQKSLTRCERVTSPLWGD